MSDSGSGWWASGHDGSGTKANRRQAGSREAMDAGTRPYRRHHLNGNRRRPTSPRMRRRRAAGRARSRHSGGGGGGRGSAHRCRRRWSLSSLLAQWLAILVGTRTKSRWRTSRRPPAPSSRPLRLNGSRRLPRRHRLRPRRRLRHPRRTLSRRRLLRHRHHRHRHHHSHHHHRHHHSHHHRAIVTPRMSRAFRSPPTSTAKAEAATDRCTTGTVRVIGPDEYGLDADNDGVGCEAS
jgi:hypothetical protein